MTKKSERAKLNRIKKMLQRYDEVQCEYFIFGNQPVFIYHQDCSFKPLIIVRPEHHSALDVKNIINDPVEDYSFYDIEDDKDRRYIEKYY